MPRATKRGHAPAACSQKLTLILWSASGEPVHSVQAFGTVARAPSFSMWDGVRYDRVPSQPLKHGVVLYQAQAIQQKASA